MSLFLKYFYTFKIYTFLNYDEQQEHEKSKTPMTSKTKLLEFVKYRFILFLINTSGNYPYWRIYNIFVFEELLFFLIYYFYF